MKYYMLMPQTAREIESPKTFA